MIANINLHIFSKATCKKLNTILYDIFYTYVTNAIQIMHILKREVFRDNNHVSNVVPGVILGTSMGGIICAVYVRGA
jgi:3-dehydroquinate dehydratase